MARSAIVGILVGVLVGESCTPNLGYPTVLFICAPNDRPLDERCPTTHVCCSDDPTTSDGRLPAYRDDISGGRPTFSGDDNDLGASGMCVYPSDIPSERLLRTGCPVPCNPTWSQDDVLTICGANRICCQTIELHADDCVRDTTTAIWRPADGRDALESLDGGTKWRPTADSTHQDPRFDRCAALAGDRTSETFRGCVGQLTTANQRGYCMALPRCATDPAEGYRSECDRLNEE